MFAEGWWFVAEVVKGYLLIFLIIMVVSDLIRKHF